MVFRYQLSTFLGIQTGSNRNKLVSETIRADFRILFCRNELAVALTALSLHTQDLYQSSPPIASQNHPRAEETAKNDRAAHQNA
jgi:hypothetical protein